MKITIDKLRQLIQEALDTCPCGIARDDCEYHGEPDVTIYAWEELVDDQREDLERKGFVVTSTGQSAYHPKHWKYIGMGDPGEFSADYHDDPEWDAAWAVYDMKKMKEIEDRYRTRAADPGDF